ncbi:TIGR04222 domain-containing membrane protein [Streptomyces caatingaensis]|uniref:TIGR04222 domain-containing membrane protein n=1 Tax=Streptomyces caatingaensis TaxID=1678637 RepID=UPI0012FEA721|nr:TIGR04222 domain-containing membrane protein [Streptomyces caatingaensis]
MVVTLVAVVAPALWTLWLWRRARHPSGALSLVKPGLLETAYLRGGAGRVTDTVITKLWQDRRVKVNGGRLTVKRPVADNAVERALLGQFTTDWAKALRTVRSDLRRHPVMEPLHHGLVAQGLLAAPRTWRLWRRALLALRVGLVVTLVTTPIADISSFPGVLAVAALGAAVAVVCRQGKRRIPYTAAGEDLARRMRWSPTDPAEHPEGHAGVVAVHGTEALTGTALRHEFRDADKADRAARRGGSSSSSSSSAAYGTASCSVVVGASCDGGWSEAGWGDGGSSSDSGGSGCSSGSSCSSCSSSSCSSSSCSS